MIARKKWRLQEPEPEESQKPWLREDGKIDLYRFDPKSLMTPEECAVATTELDKAIAYFGAQLKGFSAEYEATGIPTPKPLYYATHKLWTLAKTKRNIVQDRRGVLRRLKNAEKSKAEDIRDERLFIQTAKRMLSNDQYIAIWDAIRLQNKDEPSRESDNGEEK